MIWDDQLKRFDFKARTLKWSIIIIDCLKSSSLTRSQHNSSLTSKWLVFRTVNEFVAFCGFFLAFCVVLHCYGMLLIFRYSQSLYLNKSKQELAEPAQRVNMIHPLLCTVYVLRRRPTWQTECIKMIHLSTHARCVCMLVWFVCALFILLAFTVFFISLCWSLVLWIILVLFCVLFGEKSEISISNKSKSFLFEKIKSRTIIILGSNVKWFRW